MTVPYICNNWPEVDPIRLDGLKRRVDYLLKLIPKLEPFNSEFPESEENRKTPAVVGAERHHTYYGLPEDRQADGDLYSLEVKVTREFLGDRAEVIEIISPAWSGWLGMTFQEPIADDLFNYIGPNAPSAIVGEHIARWGEWLNHISPTGNNPPVEGDDERIIALLELLRDFGYDPKRIDDPPYELLFPSPYGMGDLSLSRDFRSRPGCLTPTGREMLSRLLPSAALAEVGENRITFRKSKMDGLYIDHPKPLIERMKLLSKLPQTDGDDLVIPYSPEVHQ